MGGVLKRYVGGWPVRTSVDRPHRVVSALIDVGGLIGILGVWQLVAWRRIVDPFWISSPLGVANAVWQLARTGQLFGDLLYTVSTAFIGLALALIVSLPIVGLLTFSPFAERVLEPLLGFVYAIPKVALIPVLILTLGLGETSQVVLVLLLVVFIFIYNLRAGSREVDVRLVAALEILGASRRDVLMHVRVPTMISYAISAMRIAGPTALTAAIFAEYFAGAGQGGLGQLIYESSLFFHTSDLFAGAIVLVPVAYGLDRALQRWSSKTSSWRSA